MRLVESPRWHPTHWEISVWKVSAISFGHISNLYGIRRWSTSNSSSKTSFSLSLSSRTFPTIVRRVQMRNKTLLSPPSSNRYCQESNCEGESPVDPHHYDQQIRTCSRSVRIRLRKASHLSRCLSQSFRGVYSIHSSCQAIRQQFQFTDHCSEFSSHRLSRHFVGHWITQVSRPSAFSSFNLRLFNWLQRDLWDEFRGSPGG